MSEGDTASSAAEWFRRAHVDLQVARLILSEVRVDHRPAAFHAQQAVEKGLKGALLLAFGQEPVRTHDISALMRRLPRSWDVQRLEAPLSELTIWVAAGRYPDEVEPDSPVVIDDVVATADEALRLLLSDLHRAGFEV